MIYFNRRNRKGNGAGVMSSSSDGAWSTKGYTQKLSFVCEKPVGGKKIVTIEVHKFTKKAQQFCCFFLN